jgi:hypothetical protein
VLLRIPTPGLLVLLCCFCQGTGFSIVNSFGLKWVPVAARPGAIIPGPPDRGPIVPIRCACAAETTVSKPTATASKIIVRIMEVLVRA